MRGIFLCFGVECDRYGSFDFISGVRLVDGREDRGLYGGGGG